MSRRRIKCLFRTDYNNIKSQQELGKKKPEVLSYKGLKGVYLNSISRNPAIRLS